MSYPIFGKTKTIVIPCGDGEDLFYDSYKEKFGIDLKDIFQLNNANKTIELKNNNCLYLFYIKGLVANNSAPLYVTCTDFTVTSHSEGVQDAALYLVLSTVYPLMFLYGLW